MRNTLVQVALDNKQDYLVFLDTDMTFPRNTLVKLVMDIEKNKKYKMEAITGLYVRKSPPYMPHVYAQFCPERKNFRMLAQFPLDKLFPVEGAGCGCLIVKSEVFKRAKQPYFKFRTNDKTKEKMYGRKGYMPATVGEDLYFFLKTKPITFCDPTIQCLHYKQVGFGIEDFLKYNEIKGDRHGFSITPEQIKTISEKYKESKSGGA
jgi:glycosyltransferase involved in cell wall biosynthesis